MRTTKRTSRQNSRNMPLRDIARIVLYLYDTEYWHYEETCSDDRRTHVFPSIERTRRWLVQHGKTLDKRAIAALNNLCTKKEDE